ncbi:MAG: glucosyl-3-phosphoglycerate synthase [Thermodesulfobacteriota bacterium]|nr:glucosyl-3-phosphoglycerate synthase [Thermodesulfobacteriota bacterium]
MDKTWIETNTFHHSAFADLKQLVATKEEKQLTISLCLPTLNEEKTIAKEIVIMKSDLMTRYPLIDEIVVVDSGSEDKTLEIAAAYGAKTHVADDIFPDLEKYKGKGENLWKSLYVASGDIIVYIDADIKNIHPRFVYALVGPLILSDTIKFSKAFYDRPIALDENKILPSGGGRVTELVVRPLFSLFFPELAQILQPLSGEYAGFREVFQHIPFPIGYGIETSMILDIYKKWGLHVMAQTDLDRRVHRNQATKALGRMAFVIMKTFFDRIESLGRMTLREELFDEMIQFILANKEHVPEVHRLSFSERPPIVDIPEYREKFGIGMDEKTNQRGQ